MSVKMSIRGVLASLGTVVWVGAALPAGAEPDLEKGEELFELCVQCHGENGQGIREAHAPAIAGQEQWYVSLQLDNYRKGIRGLHPQDDAGQRMYPMGRAIKTDEDAESLAAYVSSLTPAYPAPQLEGGDATRGQTLFVTCQACHGPQAKGMEALGGPNLTVTSDWYLHRQLANYKAGIRGTNPGDAAGMRMRPMSMTLVDDQAMKDVIAYIMSLRDGEGG